MAAAPKTTDSKIQHIQATPFWALDINPSQIQVVEGGDPEFVPEGGPRVSPCTLADANGYDRPSGMSIYPAVILGGFNDQRFVCADDFTPSATGAINRVCWTGRFSSAVCDGDFAASNDQWTINFYAFDTLTGLPGALLFNYENSGATPNMTVAQGVTGMPVGINPSLVEHVFSATLGSTFPVTLGTCYYLELYFDTNQTCFYLQSLSYEPTFDLTAEGNRSFLRRDADPLGGTPAFAITDFINLDMTMSIGFVNPAHTLARSNLFGSCFDRPAPLNDNISGFQLTPCGSATIFDNTYATHLVAPLDPYSCRKSVIDTVDQTRGDVWFRLNGSVASPVPETARATLCNSDVSGGLSGGDSLISVFRLTTIPGTGVNVNNLTQIACSDDACAAGFSEANFFPVSATGGRTQNFYFRISSFTAVDQGIYTLNIVCPIPIAPNDRCDTAIGYTNAEITAPLGTVKIGQTGTATVDGGTRGCGDTGNQSRGVWYRIVGNGNSVLLSTNQNVSGTLFDTFISVYCGPCIPTTGVNPNLQCVAFDDDVSTSVFQSELDFCAKAGVTYYVLINGFGGQVGDFGLLVRELRNVSNQPLACCEPQTCGEICEFIIPTPNIAENGENTAGPTIDAGANEACVSDGTYTNANQTNDGCLLTPPAGEDRRYGKIVEGQTILGNIWSSGQQQDRDFYLFEDLEAWSDPVTIPPVIGTPGYDHATRQARTIVRYTFSSQGPSIPRFHDWGAITNFSTCAPFLGFIFNTHFGCPQVLDKSHVFEGSATSQTGVTPNGRTMSINIRHNGGANGGYPCGTNTQYWLTLEEAFPVALCVPVATQMGDQDEGVTAGPGFMPNFAGVANTDGFLGGEPCHDADPDGVRNPTNVALACISGCDSVRRMAGCAAVPITNDRFLTITPNTPFVGRCESKVGASGGSRDIDNYKMTISGDKAYVGLRIESAYSMTAIITSDNCFGDAITYSIAATRGHCIGGGADADDVVLLNGNNTVYLVQIFATDSFVAVGSGALFANYFCADAISKYRCTVTATPVPVCVPVVCDGVTATETELCTIDPNLQYDACVALADDSTVLVGATNTDNDGCSESVFAADPIASGVPVCGSLFSTYQPFPDNIFTVDQDYWQFTVAANSVLTYSIRADGLVRALVADTGAPTSIPGARDKNGGSKCYNADIPLRILGGEDAGSCVNGDVGTLHLAPGTYSIIVSPGTLAAGLSTADLPCGMERRYRLDMTLAPYAAAPANPPVSTGAVNATTICGAVGAVQLFSPITSDRFADDGVQATNMGAPFTYYGVTYTPSQIGVGSNGYIVLGNTEVSAIARNFPNTANPNAMIAPFLADWDLNASGSGVWIRTTGGLGSETTTIEWCNVALLDNHNYRATFQCVLTRPSMNIQFNYISTSALAGTFPVLDDDDSGDGDAAEATAGIEDHSGLFGVDVSDAAGVPFRPASRGFPAGTFVLFGALPPTCCPGDADSSGVVNFADITSTLTNFNAVGIPGQQNPGDSDCSGVTNFADITSTLTNFNAICP